MKRNWIDRAISVVSPHRGLQRTRARMAMEMVQRSYDAASTGRRTQGWRRHLADANASTGPHLSNLRSAARDLVRNNAYAEAALRAIVNHTVGWGIEAKAMPANERVMEAWKAWAETTACDADGVHDFAGLQKLVTRTVAESGEVLIRRRIRRPDDGLPIAIQIQVIEPDFIDTSKEAASLPNGGRIVNGIELDPLGRKVAYWLFPEHPGSTIRATPASVRVSAENIRHVYRVLRPGQLRGVTTFAPVLLPFRDFDDFADATLMKQKVAACLSVITSDADGAASPLGTLSGTDNEIDSLSPGMIVNVPPGRNVQVVQPPSVGEYPEYTMTVLRSIASGLGVTYEDMTGDYSNVNFSSARMARIEHWSNIDDWRWRVLIPQFCDPVWEWAMEAMAIGVAGRPGITERPKAHWTAPPIPMIEPDKEGLAYQRNIRTGIMTLPEAIRERGYDPDALLEEYAESNKKLDALKIVLDSDPRQITQQGQAHPNTNTGDNSKIGDEEEERIVRRIMALLRRAA